MPEKELIQLVYVSSAKILLTDDQLSSLMTTSMTENEKYNITGLLLYNDGNFMQVIEGPRQNIEQLYQNITTDNLHSGMILLIKEAIAEREFPDWAMSFKNISLLDVEGFSDYLFDKDENHNQALISKAKNLLNHFKITQ